VTHFTGEGGRSRDQSGADAGQPGVQFIGEIDEQQKSDFLGQASALMFLIDWPEPFGLSMIEAMACGTPVLALRRGSVEEVVEDGLTGHIVDSIEEAAVALPRVMALNRRAVRRRFEERFTAKRMASDYLRVYKALLKRENAKLIANQVEPLFETAAATAEPIELAQR
jgi:glycosyltransferase involved in cell wall biosynthesis